MSPLEVFVNLYYYLMFYHIITINFAAKANFSDFTFVPKCKPVKDSDVLRLKEFIDSHNKICILTGAGISTESGIPDYRSEGVGLYARSTRRPVLYKDFCASESIRRRYWARNYVGWPRL